MKPTLVVMAAGLGSRYGGEKQLDGLGPNGEVLMEYSVYDAVQAGFHKIVFIIKPQMKETLETLCAARIAHMATPDGTPVELHFVFQDYSSLPAFYSLPAGRSKPFGTVHAALCAQAVVHEPFALINADDFYGRAAYETIYRALCELPPTGAATMVGYLLRNTVSDHGTVTRGVCVQENGALRHLKETYQIKKFPDGRIADTQDPAHEIPLDGDTLVSMNFWGFAPWIFAEMEQYFHDFLRGLAPDEQKAECLLPELVDLLICRDQLSVNVLSTPTAWFGVTYREDKEIVMRALQSLHDSRAYPPSLRG